MSHHIYVNIVFNLQLIAMSQLRIGLGFQIQGFFLPILKTNGFFFVYF